MVYKSVHSGRDCVPCTASLHCVSTLRPCTAPLHCVSLYTSLHGASRLSAAQGKCQVSVRKLQAPLSLLSNAVLKEFIMILAVIRGSFMASLRHPSSTVQGIFSTDSYTDNLSKHAIYAYLIVRVVSITA